MQHPPPLDRNSALNSVVDHASMGDQATVGPGSNAAQTAVGDIQRGSPSPTTYFTKWETTHTLPKDNIYALPVDMDTFASYRSGSMNDKAAIQSNQWLITKANLITETDRHLDNKQEDQSRSRAPQFGASIWNACPYTDRRRHVDGKWRVKKV